jgi:hypothetical protein
LFIGLFGGFSFSLFIALQASAHDESTDKLAELPRTPRESQKCSKRCWDAQGAHVLAALSLSYVVWLFVLSLELFTVY